jgi:hypothetical protein
MWFPSVLHKSRFTIPAKGLEQIESMAFRKAVTPCSAGKRVHSLNISSFSIVKVTLHPPRLVLNQSLPMGSTSISGTMITTRIATGRAKTVIMIPTGSTTTKKLEQGQGDLEHKDWHNGGNDWDKDGKDCDKGVLTTRILRVEEDIRFCAIMYFILRDRRHDEVCKTIAGK